MLRKKKDWKNPFEEGGSLYDIRDQYDKADRALILRIAKYGTRGIVRIGSVEGAPVSLETAQRLMPPRSDRLGHLAIGNQSYDHPN